MSSTERIKKSSRSGAKAPLKPWAASEAPLAVAPEVKRSGGKTAWFSNVIALALGFLEWVLTAQDFKRRVAPGVRALERYEFEETDWRLRAIYEHGYRS